MLPGSRRQRKGWGICKRWPPFSQLFPACGILELAELLRGTFTSPGTPGPLPVPPPETPALLCVKAHGAPQAGGCRQDPSNQDYISSISQLLGVGSKGAQTAFAENGKRQRFWHERNLWFGKRIFPSSTASLLILERFVIADGSITWPREQHRNADEKYEKVKTLKFRWTIKSALYIYIYKLNQGILFQICQRSISFCNQNLPFPIT